MLHAPEPEQSEVPFAILGTDAARRVLRGTGDPGGQPGRVVYVDILDPVTGRTWFGATRSWTRQRGVWHWSLELSLAADTADAAGVFGSEAGAFEITAYHEEKDPETGRVTTILAEPFELMVAEPKPAVAKTDSVSVVLSRIREMSGQKPARAAAASAFAGLPEDRFVFAGRRARPLTN
jgi:hypothetical protein